MYFRYIYTCIYTPYMVCNNTYTYYNIILLIFSYYCNSYYFHEILFCTILLSIAIHCYNTLV